MIRLEMPKEEATKLENLLKDLRATMQRAKQQMDKDQLEIDRIKASTRKKLAEIKQMV